MAVESANIPVSDEIAAGSMQLIPVDPASRPGALAALGGCIGSACHVWVARDAVTALPLAYVAIVTKAQGPDASATIHSAPGLNGNDEDAANAAGVVRRYAIEAVDLSITSPNAKTTG